MLKTTDPKIYNLIKDEEKRLKETLQMIASENYPSKAVLEAFWKHFGERKGWNQGVLHRTDRAWRHLTLIAMCGKLRWSAANHLIPTYAESTTSITGRPGLRLGAH